MRDLCFFEKPNSLDKWVLTISPSSKVTGRLPSSNNLINNPLAIVDLPEPTLPTKIGRRNLENISNLGVDVIHFKQNPIIYKKLILEGFKRVGDMEWANHMGIWSVPVHFAIKFNIPFIFWGESPQMEYGGSQTVSEINKVEFDENWLNDYGCLNGLRPQDMVSEDNVISLRP